MSNKFIVCEPGAVILRVGDVPDDAIISAARSVGRDALKDPGRLIMIGDAGSLRAGYGDISITLDDYEEADEGDIDDAESSLLSKLRRLLK